MKYAFTGQSKTVNGVTVRQIKRISDGVIGGWIESEKNLDLRDSCFVSGNACVFGDARVYGNALVFGDAWVYGNASVSGNARVFGDACVYGNALVSGDAWVFGNASVYGNDLITD